MDIFFVKTLYFIIVYEIFNDIFQNSGYHFYVVDYTLYFNNDICTLSFSHKKSFKNVYFILLQNDHFEDDYIYIYGTLLLYDISFYNIFHIILYLHEKKCTNR